MKKLFLTFTTILLLASCGQNTQEQNLQTKNKIVNTALKLGFCPTMEKDALVLQEKNKNLELVYLGSAGEVLQNLKAEKIDLALIGRKAKKLEISTKFAEKNLETTEKYTLISGQKQMIAEKDLTNISVKTCLNESAKDQFPELNLVFEQTCNYANDLVWLISWADFTNEMELFIPINENSEKARKYRNAFIYGENLNNFNL